MRWVKHMTASSRDEKLMLLRDEFGVAGYGIYWLVLEAIAEQMDEKTSMPSLNLSKKNWRKLTEISPNSFRKFALFCQKVELFLVKVEGDYTEIQCPNLLKFRDEYTLKKGRV